GRAPPSGARPLTDLEVLRREVEILKLQMEVMQAKVRAQEAELRTLRAQFKAPPAGKGKVTERPHADGMWRDAKDALKALRGAKDDAKRQRLVEVLELLLRDLRRRYPNADAPRENSLRNELGQKR